MRYNYYVILVLTTDCSSQSFLAGLPVWLGSKGWFVGILYGGLTSCSISEVLNFLVKKKLVSEMTLMLIHLATILGALALSQESMEG